MSNDTRELEHELAGLSTSAKLPRGSPPATLVTWNGSEDPDDPYNWTTRKKWLTIGLGMLASFVCSVNGTILAVAHEPISQEFGIPNERFPEFYYTTTAWGIGAALFPLFLFPLMEDLGVRPLLLGTYLCFTCSLIPVGFAQNFATVVVVRFFSGGCVPLMSDAVATIASNVFHGDRARSVPICLYVLIYLGATSLGPVIGALILRSLNWRWIGHVELMFTAAFFPFLAFGLPETRGLVILRAKAEALRRQGRTIHTAEDSKNTNFARSLVEGLQRPVSMLLRESVVSVAAVWAAFSLGSIYLFTQSVEKVYEQLYGWDAISAGYVQSAIVVGEAIGAVLSLFANSWYYKSATRNTEVPGTPVPEARLYPAIIGGFFGVSGGMLLYGWAAYSRIHWIVITTGLTMVGFGSTAVVISIANYLIDAYSKYAASALAAVGLVENVSIALLPLAAPAMYTRLGFHWASTLLAFVSLVLASMPLVVIVWGKSIRAHSPFMKEAVIDRRRHIQLSSVV
ncbi:putative MFS multidrug transporter [Myriangium duriaei CBS 260.36]|uniref:MFS multidrug transporter n=1 Tax=Myriangium duriaei CBS 260.36 TaxID=1168546 RepID=A0A9P4MFW8_9PEZI|nr:putative MFS multidrug transporter [Myriangium duriaei CBS 260.36]